MLAEQIMTRPAIRIPASARVRQAARILWVHRVPAAPVVDADDVMIGLVDETLLLRDGAADLTGPPGVPGGDATPSPPVTDVMVPAVVTAVEATELRDLAADMLRQGPGVVPCVPVLRDGRPVGMISRNDLLGVLARGDGRIREDVLAVLGTFERGPIDWGVRVRGGVARLHGHVDARTAGLVRTLSRTVPGVRRVVIVDPDEAP